MTTYSTRRQGKQTGDGTMKSCRSQASTLTHVIAASGKNTTAYGTHRKEQTVPMGLGRGSWSISRVPRLSSRQEGKDAQRTLTGKFLDFIHSSLGKRLAVGKDKVWKGDDLFFPFNSKSDSDDLCSIQTATVSWVLFIYFYFIFIRQGFSM